MSLPDGSPAQNIPLHLLTGTAYHPGSEMSPDAWREVVTQSVGVELDSLFDRHPVNTTTAEDGTNEVVLGVQLSTKLTPAHVTSKTDEAGNREAFMWLEPGAGLGTEMFRYTDGPNNTPQLEPYRIDPDTNERVPRTASEHYDPNSAQEVGHWGNVWVRNLREAPSLNEKELAMLRKGPTRLRRALGKLSFR